jgi:hypothetical protein
MTARTKPRRRSRKWDGLALASMLALGGCAVSVRAPRTVSTSSSGAVKEEGPGTLEEVAALEGRIAKARREITVEMSDGQPGDAVRTDIKAGSAAPEEEAPMAAEERQSPPPRVPPPASSAGAASAPNAGYRPPEAPPPVAPAPDRRDMPRAESARAPRAAAKTESIVATSPPRKSPRCERVQLAADEICHAAGRICEIASSLGDNDSSARCRRAEEDCSGARSASERCSP